MLRARADHVIPLQYPITDTNGRVLSDIFVPEGTEIICNVPAVNRDVDIWGQDALEWKPERWLDPLPQTNIPGVLANTYASQLHLHVLTDLVKRLTFSGGGRACMSVLSIIL